MSKFRLEPNMNEPESHESSMNTTFKCLLEKASVQKRRFEPKRHLFLYKNSLFCFIFHISNSRCDYLKRRQMCSSGSRVADSHLLLPDAKGFCHESRWHQVLTELKWKNFSRRFLQRMLTPASKEKPEQINHFIIGEKNKPFISIIFMSLV